MTGAHNFFRLYALFVCDHVPAQRNIEDFDFVSAVPHSNHNTVGTASWQNHDSSTPQSVINLHCHVCLGLSIPYSSFALWRQCKSKTQHIYEAMDIPVLLMVWGEPEACSTMRAPGMLSSAFSLNASARQGACKRSLFKSIGVMPENRR